MKSSLSTARLSARLVHLACAMAMLTVFPVAPAAAQTLSTYKIAWWNIQSGKGEPALAGRPSPFPDTSNCTDSTQPKNAWGLGLVQKELTAKIANDPTVLALGLSEAWKCASPENVRLALGWKARSAEKNGVAIVARFGFAGPVEFFQLDTTLNTDTTTGPRYIVRAPVCADAACNRSVETYFTHWYANGTSAVASMQRQAQGAVDFMARLPAGTPRVMMGDLNVWEGSADVCGQKPVSRTILDVLRAARYTDAWTQLKGTAEGFTGMTNRKGCGSPEGYAWKRIDYAWAFNQRPISIARFGVAPAGDAAPSDHYGLVVEFPLPGQDIYDVTPPATAIVSPTDGATVSNSVAVSASASDNVGVAKVELLVDGKVLKTDTTSPYSLAWDTRTMANGLRSVQARAYDAAGNRGESTMRMVNVVNSVDIVVPPSDVIIAASSGTIIGNAWRRVADLTAASGSRVSNPDAGAAKVAAPLSAPASYVQVTFTAEKGKPYRLWIRGRADRNYWGNDSAYVQFSDSVDAFGQPKFRIGTASATTYVLENASGSGLAGWGWQDNAYGVGALGAEIYFATTGTHTIRIQKREDGLSIDQIVLSPARYLTAAPGATKNDTTILIP